MDDNKRMMGIYSIKDIIALEYGPLFLAKNSGVAKRQYLNMMAEQRVNQISDYCLYELGWYDPETGLIITHAIPEEVEL